MSDARLNIRIDGELKEKAKETFDALGMDITTAVTIFLKQSVREGALPFQPKLHTPETLQALKEIEAGDLASFNNLDELWEDLNAD